MKHLFYVFCFIFTCSLSFANDIERVSIMYEYRSDNPQESPEQAERTAIERAKQKALEEKFGVDVSSINSTYISSKSNGQNAKTQTNVFSLGGTSVKGEWLQTIEEKVLDKQFQQGFWYVKVYVEGKARKQNAETIEIKSTFINNAHDKYSRDIFHDGDDIFLRFSAPVDGCLCVYLIDESQNAFCLLPYANNRIGYQAIIANTEYLFFDSTQDPKADEYTLSTESEQENNALYVIFSPNNFTKANDQTGGQNFRQEMLPRTLPYPDFLKWLAKNQIRDPQMVVKTELIQIKK